MLDRKPRVGDWVRWGVNDAPVKIVEVKENGIAWFKRPGQRDPSCFIYKFQDGFNKLAEFCNPPGDAT